MPPASIKNFNHRVSVRWMLVVAHMNGPRFVAANGEQRFQCGAQVPAVFGSTIENASRRTKLPLCLVVIQLACDVVVQREDLRLVGLFAFGELIKQILVVLSILPV